MVEDVFIHAGPSRLAVPIPASRLVADGARWRIDPSVPIDPLLLGAPVIAVRDGAVVGLVVFEAEHRQVNVIPASMVADASFVED